MIKVKTACFAILLSLVSFLVKADERTDVVVLGNNASSIAASIQSARSGVKTIWINPSASLDEDILKADTAGAAGSGIWPEFVNILKAKPGQNINDVVKGFVDTVKNLTIINNAPVRKIERAGKGWEVKLVNGREIKCQVIVDGGKNTTFVEKAPADITESVAPSTIAGTLYSSRLYRTAVATGNNPADVLPLGSMISKTENYIFARTRPTVAGSMNAGQAAGASAAYCAYFKRTTRTLEVRMTQGELLRYNAALLPVSDISSNDSAFIPIQHILATGILKVDNGNFNPEGTLSSEELRLPLKDFYSRSQLWFFNNKRDSLTIEDAINLIMFTATRGEELRREISGGWKSSLKMATNYDPKRKITRKEFAVLLDRYLQPFIVRVDFYGNLLS